MLRRPFSASGTRSEMSLVGEDMDIKLELLETITEKFSEALKVGGGGYGNVYRVRHTQCHFLPFPPQCMPDLYYSYLTSN